MMKLKGSMEGYFLTSLNLSIITLVPPILLLLRCWQIPVFRWLALFLMFWLSSELFGKTLYFFKINPNYAGNNYIIFSTILISYYFYHAIGWKRLEKVFVFINFFYFLFAVCNVFLLQKLLVNSYTYTVQAFLILFFSLVFFFKLLQVSRRLQSLKQPNFIIISAIFFSFAGKLILYMTFHYFTVELKDNMLLLWTIHNWLTIICNCLICVGCYIQVRDMRMVENDFLKGVDR